MLNFILIILDGVGIGELPDAARYGDSGSNTLANTAEFIGGMDLPALKNFGLGNIAPVRGIDPVDSPLASFGKMKEVSKGKDSTSGHWEIAGLNVNFDFPLYPRGFPDELMDDFLKKTGINGILGNKTASGTEIITELGKLHIETGYPIIYTSADSVFQVAAHERIFGLDRLYEICGTARKNVLVGEHAVGRVIARPFIGEIGNFRRTVNRKDFSLDPFEDTILDLLLEEGINTVAVGKVDDLFNHRGIKVSFPTKSNIEGIEKIIYCSQNFEKSLIFANLVDFDVYFGHRNDPRGFYGALREFDNHLSEIIDTLDKTDALIITADHGNDPTTPSTDHSREYVPLLFYKRGKSATDLGVRSSFSDVAQTIAHFFNLNNSLKGTSFLND